MNRIFSFLSILFVIFSQQALAGDNNNLKFAASKYLSSSFAPAPGVRETRAIASLDFNQVGVASWYGPRFVGRKTASGDIFNPNLMTAAHRYLPLNSVVRVTNLSNNRSVDVIINDRGPYSKKDRIIDLSRKAAQELGFCRQGLTKVTVEYLHGETLAFSHSISASKRTKLASDIEKISMKKWKSVIKESRRK